MHKDKHRAFTVVQNWSFQSRITSRAITPTSDWFHYYTITILESHWNSIYSPVLRSPQCLKHWVFMAPDWGALSHFSLDPLVLWWTISHSGQTFPYFPSFPCPCLCCWNHLPLLGAHFFSLLSFLVLLLNSTKTSSSPSYSFKPWPSNPSGPPNLLKKTRAPVVESSLCICTSL